MCRVSDWLHKAPRRRRRPRSGFRSRQAWECGRGDRSAPAPAAASPPPSDPITRTMGAPSNACSKLWSPVPARPTMVQPRSDSLSSARARFTARTTATLSTAPAAAFANAPPSWGACRSCITTPRTPKAAADRRIAPTFCGSRHLIQHEEHALRRRCDILESLAFQRRGLHRHPLVRCAGRQTAGDVAVLQGLHLQPRREQGELRRSLRRRDNPVGLGTRGIGQRRLHCVPAPQPARRIARQPASRRPPGAPLTRSAKGRFPVVAFVGRGHYKTPSDLGLIRVCVSSRCVEGESLKRKAMIEGLFILEEQKRNDVDSASSPPPVRRRSGGVAERSMAADCKSADECLRWFESNPLHHRRPDQNSKRV